MESSIPRKLPFRQDRAEITRQVGYQLILPGMNWVPVGVFKPARYQRQTEEAL